MANAMIARIRTTGLQASDIDLPLSRLVLLLGPVGSGKTTHHDALQFAALGYVPRLGKALAETARLMRGSEMVVEVTLDDGRMFQRAVARTGNNLSSGAFASWLPPKTKATEASEAIKALFGASELEAAQSLDLRQLLAASPAHRAASIEALLDASSRSPEELGARGGALTVLRLAGVEAGRMPADTHEAMAAAGGADMLIGRLHRRAGLFVARELEALLSASGLANAIEHAKEERNRHGAAAKELAAARGQIEDRRVALAWSGAASADLQARHDKAATERDQAERDIALAERSEEARIIASSDIPAAEEEIARAEVALVVASGALEKAQALRAEADTFVDPPPIPLPNPVGANQAQHDLAAQLEDEALAIADPPEVPPVERVDADADAEAKARELDKASAQLQAEWASVAIPLALSTAAEAAAVTVAERELERAASSPWRQVEEIARTIKRDALRDAWLVDMVAQLLVLAASHGGDQQAATERLCSAQAELARATEAARERQGDIDAASAKRRALELRILETQSEAGRLRYDANQSAMAANERANLAWVNACAERRETIAANEVRRRELRAKARKIRDEERARCDDVDGRARAAYQSEMAERDEEIARRRCRRADLIAQAEAIEERAATAQQDLDRAKAALATLRAKVEGIEVVAIDRDKAVARRDAASEEVARSAASLEVARTSEALHAEMQALIAKIEEATAMGAAYAAAVWACERLREEDLAARGRGIEERMRRFLVAAGRVEEPYLRSARGVCDFGIRRPDGAQVAVETLSGGESALFMAALASAVIALRHPEIRVLLVEGAELGPGEPIAAMLRGIEAVADDLDLVVVATNSPVEPGPAWSVVRVETREAVTA